MPTGYTATLMEKNQTFPEFIMGCARAFGALIMMRDDPNDATIPDKFEPSDYHAKGIIKAREKLAKLKAMTDGEKLAFGQTEKDEDIKHKEQYLETNITENNRLEDMEASVKAWSPPSDDHVGLKDFMLQQIGISKNDLNYTQKPLARAIEKPAMAYCVAAVSRSSRDIKYHTEENTKEIERATGRTEWVRQLRSSI